MYCWVTNAVAQILTALDVLIGLPHRLLTLPPDLILRPYEGTLTWFLCFRSHKLSPMNYSLDSGFERHFKDSESDRLFQRDVQITVCKRMRCRFFSL